MNRILNRYVAKEITVPFFLGLAAFTSILLMDKILKLTELVVDKGVKLTEVLSLIAYILPAFLAITIPMAFLLAVLMAFGRLSADEELTAIKSSGISLAQMMPPVLTIAAAAFLATLLMTAFAMPWGNHSFKTKTYQIVREKVDAEITPGKVIDSFGGMALYVSREERATGRFKGVLLSDERDGTTASTIVAREGEIVAQPDDLSVTLRLYDGTIHREGLKNPLQYNVINFDTYDITLSMDFEKRKERRIQKGDRELSIAELLERARRLREKGGDYNYLMVELHKKFSIPFACIVFAFIGVPLGIQGKRSGKAHGFVVTLILVMVYWAFLLAGEAMGDRGKVPPFLGMWAPNIFFLLIGLHLLRKISTEREIRFLTLFEDLYGATAWTLKSLFRWRRDPGNTGGDGQKKTDAGGV